MKKLIPGICLLIFSTTAFSQSKADYEHFMKKFKTFYNHNQSDSLENMYGDEWAKWKGQLMPMKELKVLKKDYGEMKSYTYLGVTPEDSVTIFKTVFTKHTHTMGVLLDKKNKIDTFRFETSSDEIDSLLKATHNASLIKKRK
ncbi:MAG TPA: hypothetical protein VHA52_02690 [Candidatus Babeliaceae bacterium]|nr:hypothetical protein [Candidatus Babeliaceae bacterium]